MKKLIYSVILALCAVPVTAETCYTRHYSEAHMAANPDQWVTSLKMTFVTDGDLLAFVKARFKHDDAEYYGDFSCAEPPWVDEGVWVCAKDNFFMTKGFGSDALLVYTHGGLLLSGPDGTEPRWVIDENTTESMFKLEKAALGSCD